MKNEVKNISEIKKAYVRLILEAGPVITKAAQNKLKNIMDSKENLYLSEGALIHELKNPFIYMSLDYFNSKFNLTIVPSKDWKFNSKFNSLLQNLVDVLFGPSTKIEFV